MSDLDPSRKVVPFRPAATANMETLASAWEGLVRIMEANGRATVEISLADARKIAVMMRRAV